MNEEENDFFERCFGIVAGLEVESEAQAIAKEVVLDEIENLQQENQQLKDRINKALEYLKEKEDSLFMTFDDYMLDHDELIDKKIGLTLLEILKGDKE